MSHTITTARPTSPSPRAATESARWVHRSLMTGGGMWIAYYAMWLISGTLTGAEPVLGTAFYVFTNALFAAALIGINGGLAGLALRMRTHTPILSYVSFALAVFGVASVTYGFFGRVLLGDRIGFPGGNAVLTSCFSATLLGIAAFRSQALPRRTTALLLFIGILTFPLIVALGMIANLWLPAWATDELPFAMCGALWLTFGARMHRH